MHFPPNATSRRIKIMEVLSFSSDSGYNSIFHNSAECSKYNKNDA
jgi:hypothetical protein